MLPFLVYLVVEINFSLGQKPTLLFCCCVVGGGGGEGGEQLSTVFGIILVSFSSLDSITQLL